MPDVDAETVQTNIYGWAVLRAAYPPRLVWPSSGEPIAKYTLDQILATCAHYNISDPYKEFDEEEECWILRWSEHGYYASVIVHETGKVEGIFCHVKVTEGRRETRCERSTWETVLQELFSRYKYEDEARKGFEYWEAVFEGPPVLVSK